MIRYIIKSKVAKISNKVIRDNPNAWFVLFEGSWEWVPFGDQKPIFGVGESVRIIIEGEERPCPSPTTSSNEN